MKSTRVFQLTTLALVLVSVVQVGWWLFDQQSYAKQKVAAARGAYAEQAAAAQVLLEGGTSPERIAALLPNITIAGGRAAIAPAAQAALAAEEKSRQRQYAWEGAFFLLALGLCIAVIARALRAEARVLEEQDSFLALVSHQFKTPLASLQLSLETLALRSPPPEQARVLIERMLADLTRMELMVTQILESARLERGRVEFRSENLELAAAVARVVTQMEERARRARVTIVVSIEPDLKVMSDPLALDMVVRNVLENALAALTPAGGGSVTLTGRKLFGRGGTRRARQRRGLRARRRRAPVPEVHAPAPRRRWWLLRHGAGALHRAAHDGARARPGERAQRRPRTGGALRAHLARGPGAAVSREGAARVLVVEDDPHLSAGVLENLRAEGYEAHAAGDGEQALAWLKAYPCELIVLDVMLPGIDGFGVCRALRGEGNNTPVLFLTARGDPADRLRGLESGGDDYLAKPFHLQEFLLRVRAILRRWDWYRGASATADTAVLSFDGNEVDFRAFRARGWNGESHELTEKEAMILKVLAEHGGEIVSREDLLEKVWGYDVFPSTRTVDNFILRLRKRFERDPANPRHFLTVWGVGYRFLREGEP